MAKRKKVRRLEPKPRQEDQTTGMLRGLIGGLNSPAVGDLLIALGEGLNTYNELKEARSLRRAPSRATNYADIPPPIPPPIETREDEEDEYEDEGDSNG